MQTLSDLIKHIESSNTSKLNEYCNSFLNIDLPDEDETEYEIVIDLLIDMMEMTILGD